MHFTLCDMFSDLTQNAVEAGARTITVELDQSPARIGFRVKDDGKGMTAEELQKASDPFYTDGIKHPGRKIGLGIPFLIQTAESTGGSWNISSEKGRGTLLESAFDPTNIDTPPVGSVAGFIRQVLTLEGSYEMIVRRTRKTDAGDETSYEVRRSELLEALGLAEAGSFTDANALALLGTYLESMEE